MSVALALGCLGHRDHRVRWRAVHALVTWAEVQPDVMARALAGALSEEVHPWWMAVREWAAFTLTCVAVRTPEAIRQVAPTLARAALSRTFPHVRVRETLRTALLTADATAGGVLDEIRVALGDAVVADLHAVNRPRWLSEEDAWARRRARQSAAGDDVEGRSPTLRRFARGGGRAFPDGLLDVTDFDSESYRYESLERAFDVPAGTVGRLVARYATVMTRFTPAQLAEDADRMTRRGERAWRAAFSDRGDAPRIDTRRHYAEWHGLALAAGRLIDTAAVTRVHYSDAPNRTAWDDWCQFGLWLGDPSLPSRLVDAAPLRPEFYGRFAEPLATWLQRPAAAAFHDALRHEEDSDWLIVAESSESHGEDRRVSLRTYTALVGPARARSLCLALRGADALPLPQFELRDEILLHDVERMLSGAAGTSPSEDRWAVHHGPYELAPWIAQWSPTGGATGVADFDERTPAGGASAASIPAAAFLTALQAVRPPGTLSWRSADGREIVRVERWSDLDQPGGRDDERLRSTGHRMLVRRDAVEAYVRAVGARLTASVHLHRKPYDRYERDRESLVQKVPGYDGTMTFLLAADGSWTLDGEPAPNQLRAARPATRARQRS